MIYLHNILKKYPLSLLLVLVIWVICLVPIPESPLSHVNLIDKWTHIALYFVLSSVIAFESMNGKQKKTGTIPVFWIWVMPVLMGGAIELVQAYCTNGIRSGEWLDFAADTAGATLALIICILLARCRAKG